MPADLTLAQCKAVHDYENHLLAGAYDAIGTKALAAAAKDKNLDTVTVHIPMLGRDRYEVTWTREVERNAGIQQKDGPPPPREARHRC